MIVRDAMTGYFASAHTSSTVGDALEKILGEGLSTLLIVDDRSRLVGSLGEELLFESLFGGPSPDDPVTAHMTGLMVTVAPDEPIESAIRKFRHELVSELPVVGAGKLVGILTRRQLLRACLKQSRSERRTLRAG